MIIWNESEDWLYHLSRCSLLTLPFNHPPWHNICSSALETPVAHMAIPFMISLSLASSNHLYGFIKQKAKVHRPRAVVLWRFTWYSYQLFSPTSSHPEALYRPLSEVRIVLGTFPGKIYTGRGSNVENHYCACTEPVATRGLSKSKKDLPREHA